MATPLDNQDHCGAVFTPCQCVSAAAVQLANKQIAPINGESRENNSTRSTRNEQSKSNLTANSIWFGKGNENKRKKGHWREHSVPFSRRRFRADKALALSSWPRVRAVFVPLARLMLPLAGQQLLDHDRTGLPIEQTIEMTTLINSGNQWPMMNSALARTYKHKDIINCGLTLGGQADGPVGLASRSMLTDHIATTIVRCSGAIGRPDRWHNALTSERAEDASDRMQIARPRSHPCPGHGHGNRARVWPVANRIECDKTGSSWVIG